MCKEESVKKIENAVVRMLILLLCMAVCLPVLPAGADWQQPEEWFSEMSTISGKVLEYCLTEDRDHFTLYAESSLVRKMQESAFVDAIHCALDMFCKEDFTFYRTRQSSGGVKIEFKNLHLRSGLLMLEAYFSGDRSLLTRDERKCLDQVSSLMDKLIRQYGYGSINLELAIYDYICEHVEYRNYPAGDSRRMQCTSACNAFLYGWGNCQAYSDLFYMMTNMGGIDSGYISGWADGERHIWNTVGIGTASVMVDVTYGDLDNQEYTAPEYYYFNFGLDRVNTHKWVREAFSYNQTIDRKTNDKYSYYSGQSDRYGCVANKLSEVAQYAVKQVKKGRKYAEVLLKKKGITFDNVHSALKKAIGKQQGKWTVWLDEMDDGTVVRIKWKEYKNKKIR